MNLDSFNLLIAAIFVAVIVLVVLFVRNRK